MRKNKQIRTTALLLAAMLAVPNSAPVFGAGNSGMALPAPEITDTIFRASDSNADVSDPSVSTASASNASEDGRDEYIIRKFAPLDREIRNQDLPEGEFPEECVFFPEFISVEIKAGETIDAEVSWEPDDGSPELSELKAGDVFSTIKV